MTQSTQTSVRVELQYTKNLGNYESLKVSIGVEDFMRQGENANTATDRVYAFVEGKVIEKVNEITEELKGKK